jgi:parallel beta-helix repeat protein
MMASLSFVAILAVSMPAWSVEYFVDQNNPQAADAGPGSSAKPFKTISASLAHVRPGDTVWIHKGLYREFVNLQKISGTGLGSMIAFQACPGEEVVIKGSDVITGWKPFKGKIWVLENWTNDTQQAFADGKLIQEIGGDIGEWMKHWWNGRKGNVLADMEENSFFCDTKEKKLYVWLPGGTDPNQRTVEVSVRDCWAQQGDYVRLCGVTILHGYGYALNVMGKFSVFENVKVEWAAYGCLGVHGSDHVFTGCEFNYGGDTGVTGGVRRARFVNCKMLHNNYRRISSSFHAGGVKLIPFNHDVVFEGCEAAYNVESAGIWFDAHASGAVIENCLLHHNGADGIVYEICERGMIRNNICYENVGPGISVASSANTAVLHNTCYRNGREGILVIGATRADSSYGRGEGSMYPAGHNLVWGNIMVDNANPALCPKGNDGSGHTWDKRPELILPQEEKEIDTGNVSDYNIFYRSDGRGIPFWKGWDNQIGKDLAQWQQKSGQDKHSMVADPKFVNAAKLDFHPAGDSPVLWMVKPSMGVVRDYEKKDRPTGMDGPVRAYYTAGALEPDEKITKARLASTRPAEVGQFALVNLPKDRLQILYGYGSDDYSRDGVYGAMAKQEFKNLRGKMGVELAGVPFEQYTPSEGIVLVKAKPTASIPLAKAVKKLHILFAAVATGKEGPAVECVMKREDGKTITLAWEAGKTLAPALGDWTGKLEAGPGPDAKTEVVWEGTLPYSTNATGGGTTSKVRLLRTTWRNENEWYPIKELAWTLKNLDAQIVILGITAE